MKAAHIAQFSACHFLMLDDLGTKVPLDRLDGFDLSWLIETSPGNHQGGIILAEPNSFSVCSMPGSSSSTRVVPHRKHLFCFQKKGSHHATETYLRQKQITGRGVGA